MAKLKRFLGLLLVAIMGLLLSAGIAEERSLLILPQGMKSIEKEAFYGVQSIDEIVLPDSIKKIGSKAFADSSITEINLPASITSIADDAFAGCDKYEITAQEGSYAHGWAVVRGLLQREGDTPVSDFTYSIKNAEAVITAYGGTDPYVVIPAQIEGYPVTSVSMQSNAVVKWVILPNTVTVLPGSAFKGCTGLESIVLPEGLESIENYAFMSCSSLKELSIPDSVTNVGSHIISGAYALERLEIGGGVQSVTYSKFGIGSSSQESELKELIIREGVTSIGKYAFRAYGDNNCNYPNLESVELPSTLKTIGEYAFNNCISLARIAIPGSVTSIGEWAFAGCTAMNELTIEEGEETRSIGMFAFRECTSLIDVVIPIGITNIGEHAFYGCKGLESIKLPEGLESIENYAFMLCSSLKELLIPDDITIINSGLFSGCTDLRKVILPKGITSIYKSAFPTNGVLVISAFANSYAHEWLEANWSGEYKIYTRESTYYGNKSVGTEDENIQATYEVVHKYKTSDAHQFDTYLEYDDEYPPYLFELFVQEYQDDLGVQASVATSEIVDAVKNGISDVVALAFGDVDTGSLWALLSGQADEKKIAQAIVDYLVTADVNVPTTQTMRGILTSDGGQFFRKWLGKWMGMGVDTPEEMEETWKKAWEELHDTIEKLEAKEAILSAEEIEIVSIMKNAKFRDYSDEALAEVVSKIRFTEKSTGKIYTFGDMLDINAGNAKSISKKITQYDNELLKGKDSITFNIDSNWDTNVKWSFRTDVEKTLYPSNEKTVFDYIEDKRGEVEAKAKELENKYPDKADKWSTALEGVLFSKWIFDAVLEGMDAYKQVAEYEAVLAVHEKELRSILNNTNCENIEAVVDEVLSILREGTANSLIHAIMESEEKLIADFVSDAIGDAVVDALTKVLPKANIYTIIFDFGTDVAMLLCDASNTKLKVWGVEYLYDDYQSAKQNLIDAIDMFYSIPTSETYNQLYYTAKYYALIVRSSSNQVSIILKSDAESFTGWVQSFFDKIPVEDRVEDAKEIPIKDDLKLIFFLDMLFPTAEPI